MGIMMLFFTMTIWVKKKKKSQHYIQPSLGSKQKAKEKGHYRKEITSNMIKHPLSIFFKLSLTKMLIKTLSLSISLFPICFRWRKKKVKSEVSKGATFKGLEEGKKARRSYFFCPTSPNEALHWKYCRQKSNYHPNPKGLCTPWETHETILFSFSKA